MKVNSLPILFTIRILPNNDLNIRIRPNSSNHLFGTALVYTLKEFAQKRIALLRFLGIMYPFTVPEAGTLYTIVDTLQIFFKKNAQNNWRLVMPYDMKSLKNYSCKTTAIDE